MYNTKLVTKNENYNKISTWRGLWLAETVFFITEQSTGC